MAGWLNQQVSARSDSKESALARSDLRFAALGSFSTTILQKIKIWENLPKNDMFQPA